MLERFSFLLGPADSIHHQIRCRRGYTCAAQLYFTQPACILIVLTSCCSMVTDLGVPAWWHVQNVRPHARSKILTAIRSLLVSSLSIYPGVGTSWEHQCTLDDSRLHLLNLHAVSNHQEYWCSHEVPTHCVVHRPVVDVLLKFEGVKVVSGIHL